MKKHLTISIHGVVQGVFFRASTRNKADELGITGLVKNEPDGSVYVEAEGDEKSLESFVQWCQHGPPRAEIERCDVKEEPVKNFSRFTIEQ